MNNVQQWEYIESQPPRWQRNSEFGGAGDSETIVTRKSAVIMLVLDCTTSLNADGANGFSQMKTAAKRFIDVLVSGSGSSGGGGETRYTVTFNANGGSGTVQPMSANFGSSITLPNGITLSRTGYTFGGWNTNAAGTGTAYNAGASFTVTASVTLYAKWNSGGGDGGTTGTEANPIPLTAGIWANGSITSTASDSAVWYSFNVQSGTTYYVWWNDSDSGNGTKTLDVWVSATINGDLIFSEDNGWSGRYFVSNQSGPVKIIVEPYWVGGTGTFAVAYRAGNSTRP